MNVSITSDQIRHIIYALEQVETQTVQRHEEAGTWESPCDACPTIIDKLKRSIGQGGYSGWYKQPMETA